MIFVDTGSWYALVVKNDPNHQKAIDWLQTNQLPLITTDYVLCETLTLLRSRRQNHVAIALGERILSQQQVELYFLTPADIQASWEIFRRFDDKEWSFTDCSSKHIMEKLAISQAFAFDHHFAQFGNLTVAP